LKNYFHEYFAVIAGNTGASSAVKNTQRSTDVIKTSFANQRLGESCGMSPPFALDDQPMAFGAAGLHELTNISPIVVRPSGTLLDLGHRPRDRSHRLRTHHYNDVIEISPSSSANQCLGSDDVSMPLSGSPSLSKH
jgi:hypothetical protein